MKFALVDGEKEEARKGVIGICQVCGSELIAKCGDIKVHHWSHKGKRNCDEWWESETEWHREWKNEFPIEWQEVVHFDESGEKHIADLKTYEDWCIEFQHSFLNPQERNARIAFYSKLVWVVDGLRRKRDKLQFKTALEESISENGSPYICSVRHIDEYRLLNEWHNNSSLVFFDFQEVIRESDLWLLLPAISSDQAYLAPFSRSELIESHNKNNFDELVKNTIRPIHEALSKRQHVEKMMNMQSRPNILQSIDRRFARRMRRL